MVPEPTLQFGRKIVLSKEAVALFISVIMADKRHKEEKLQTAKGMHDILPQDYHYFTFLKKVVRHRFRQSGFKRISTPILEYSEVFTRPLGEQTDIVQKEMYSLEDKSGNSLTLRPENTAPVVRAYIQHGMASLPQPVELWYWEPMFRYDRPQKGRYRQFYQLGVEIIGESDPALDAQVVHLGCSIFNDIGLRNSYSVQVNSIGCKECRPDYIQQLQHYYYGKQHSLCADCKQRLEENPLRLLDCKHEDCSILAQMAPNFADFICADCKEFQRNFLSYLDELQIPYQQNNRLVRGLDYYNRTVFEWGDKSSGAQNSLGGGGRYDYLVGMMGGQPNTPAVGFAAGVERLVANMKEVGFEPPFKDVVDVFVAQLGPEAKKKCLPLIAALRDAGVRTVGAVGKSSMKAQMRLADRFSVQYCLILGEREVLDKKIILRNMRKAVQETLPFAGIVAEVAKR